MHHANDLILFAQIVEAGSFTGAARVTAITKATLSRRLAALEEAYGERLLQRTTRQLVLTEFGERMLPHARRLAFEAAEANALAMNRREEPQGTLRISLPPDYRELALEQVLPRFMELYPQIRLELDLSARRVDVLAERFDLVIRAASQLPDDATLVARRLITLDGGLYASAAYLKQYGTPASPQELADHMGLMMLASSGQIQPWQLTHQKSGKKWQGQPTRILCANSVSLQRALAHQHMGIVGTSLPHGGKGRNENAPLIRILPQWQLPSVVIWCITPGRRLLPRRTEVFLQVLKDTFAKGLNRPDEKKQEREQEQK